RNHVPERSPVVIWLDMRIQIKSWAIYFLVVLLSLFFHELGHCVVAWVNGIRAVPTAAKEYPLDPVPDGVKYLVSAGGVAATIVASLLGLVLFAVKKTKNSLSFLAGVTAMPVLYSTLFFFKGRGHDGTEFQEFQSVVGASYSGHFSDWTFVVLSLAAIILWVVTEKPTYRCFPRLLLRALLTFAFIVGLQEANNSLFDRLFARG
ncbi:MAG TPA: hypothetical protein VHE54_19225, partial [Puia sp.]|nr:hypothetical protein [Puia sp.]